MRQANDTLRSADGAVSDAPATLSLLALGGLALLGQPR